MAKFKTNHGGKSRSAFNMRMWVLILVFGMALIFLFKKMGHKEQHNTDEIFWSHALDSIAILLPEGESHCKRHYCIRYNRKTGQADWAAYILSREQLNKKNVPRLNYFITDSSLGIQMVTYKDYIGSSYSRGHLVPAADMAFSDTAMAESFLMSNICPQDEIFNSGIWRELESQIRKWTRKYDRLFILTGPVFKDVPFSYINNKRKIAIPQLFFKIICNPFASKMECVAFLIPNKPSDLPLDTYVISIDSIEALTNVDFFSKYLTDSLEQVVESNLSAMHHWPIDTNLFKKRIEEWNYNVCIGVR